MRRESRVAVVMAVALASTALAWAPTTAHPYAPESAGDLDMDFVWTVSGSRGVLVEAPVQVRNEGTVADPDPGPSPRGAEQAVDVLDPGPGAGHVRVDAAPAPRHVAGEEIQFRCPEGPMGLPVAPGGDPVDRTVFGCPLRIYDTTNPFGNSDLTIFHDDHREVAFCGLHGAPARDGTHGYSRTGQTHMVFTSDDQGLSWNDQPIWGGPGQGDTASCIMDSAGMLYIAYLWSHPRGLDDNRTYSSTVQLFKAGPTTEQGNVGRAYHDEFEIESVDDHNPIEQVHLELLPKIFIPDNATAAEEEGEDSFDDYYGTGTESPRGNGTGGNGTGNGTGGGSAENGTYNEFGDWTVPGNWTEEMVVLVYHEGVFGTTRSGKLAVVGGSIKLWHTDTGSRNNWTQLPPDQEIGPCLDGSEPAVVDQYVYVACVVADGYTHRARARIGDVDIWRIDTRSMESELVDTTDVQGLNPKLAANKDGYMMLTTHRVVADEATGEPSVEIRVAHGWHGSQWNEITIGWGTYLHEVAGNRAFLDADITALSVSDDEPTGLLVYKEFHPPASEQTIQEAIDTGKRLIDITKIVVSFDECTGPLAAAQFTLGSQMDPYQGYAYAENPEVYNDIQDGLMKTRDPGGGELWYFSVNDYGAMQYGAIITASATDTGCIVTPFIPQVPPPPVPQALTLANPYTTYMGAALGATAVAMIGYALSVRRKAPHTLAAEDN